MQFEYGFEVEYTFADFKKFSGHPCVKAAQTLPLTDAGFEASVQKAIEQGENGDRTQLAQIATTNCRWTLFRDDTKNLEAASKVYSNKGSAQSDLNELLSVTGPGSLQAMVSLPYEDFFGPAEVSDRMARVQQILGWLHFHHQLDLMERLQRNTSSGAIIGQFLSHPFLGPMTALRHHLLRKCLTANAKGEGFSPEELNLVRFREHSFKFVGSTIYRPDLAGPKRICLEVRDAHRNLDLLWHRVERIERDFSRSLAPFAPFALKPFDSAQAYTALPEAVQLALRKIYPPKIPAIVAHLERASFAHETFRQFAWPLYQWEDWCQVLPALDPGAIESARSRWRNDMDSLSRNESFGVDEKNRLGLSLLEFFLRSGLLMAFRNKRVELDADRK